MLAEQNDSSTSLPDNLLALPIWAATSAIGLLAAGVTIGFVFLLAPGLSGDRSVGSQLLIISLPTLALSIGVVGASWARTHRIDSMEETFLRSTVGKKLEAYLVGADSRSDDVGPYPPLFERIESSYRSSISSFCNYHLYDEMNRRFDILVKSNVFNFEIAFYLTFSSAPLGYEETSSEISYDAESLKNWSGALTNSLLRFVSSTIHGSISEGYTVYIQTQLLDGDELRVTYRLRQKLQSNFLTSPYMRRYFSEDAAIASYFFFSEALAEGKDWIVGGIA